MSYICVAMSEENILKILGNLIQRHHRLLLQASEIRPEAIIMKSKIVLILLIFTCLCFPQVAHTADADKIPDGFVDIQKVIPEIVLDIRYYSVHNFVGERLTATWRPKCL